MPGSPVPRSSRTRVVLRKDIPIILRLSVLRKPGRNLCVLIPKSSLSGKVGSFWNASVGLAAYSKAHLIVIQAFAMEHVGGGIPYAGEQPVSCGSRREVVEQRFAPLLQRNVPRRRLARRSVERTGLRIPHKHRTPPTRRVSCPRVYTSP